MWAKWVAFYRRQSVVYPERWYWPIVRIFGGPGNTVCYMTRVILLRWRRGGQGLYLHVFHREDWDRDPHDHPYDFWTCPLNQGYTEEVYDPEKECFSLVHVPRLRFSFRPATHIHRIVKADRGWPLVTLVWRGPTSRGWGFWTHSLWQWSDRPRPRFWTPWKKYVWDGENANVDGADVMCPGNAPRQF